MRIGIVGAGIMGRLLAWTLAKHGVQVSLFDRDVIQHRDTQGQATAYTAAGMLTPISEAESAEPLVVEAGLHALTRWPDIVKALGVDVDFQQKGSLVLAHPQDHADLLNFRQHVARLPQTHSAVEHLGREHFTALNAELASRFSSATLIKQEAWLSPPALLCALAEDLQTLGAELVDQVEITHIANGCLASDRQRWPFDHVIDCRGLGAKPDLPSLRGVRGEVIWVHAPEVNIQHLVRLMHPRYRIYIVPRAHNRFVIGATEIESADQQPITVRSALELLSAAYSVHPGFSEANIIQTRTSCRPALPDNLPRLYQEPGILRINGLYRHGFLLAPVIAQAVVALLLEGTPPEGFLQQLLRYPKPGTLTEPLQAGR